MNRRNFFKLAALCGFSLPFLGFGKAPKPVGDLEDFFAFCESHTVPMPWLPTDSMYQWQYRPFKLTKSQKFMAKIIHENRYVFVIKGRQIGFSTLMAAYAAWYKTRIDQNMNIWGAAHSNESMVLWNQRYARFSGETLEDGQYLKHGSWLKPDCFNLVFLDELNYDDRCFTTMLNMAFDEMENGYVHEKVSPGKMVVGGTPDPRRKLYAATENPKYKKFKILQEPVTHYPELWDGKRLSNCIMAGVPERELFT